MMAALLPETTRLCFENTGREHPRTLDFIEQLNESLGRRIVWLEWRPPPEQRRSPDRI